MLALRHTFIYLLATTSAACVQSIGDIDTSRLPYLAVFKPTEGVGGPILLLAGSTAPLVISDQRVLLGDPQNGYRLPVFYPGTGIGRDNRGLYIEDPRTGRHRDGEVIKFGGGELPLRGAALNKEIQKQVPDACWALAGESVVSVNPEFRKR